ncbi:MAG: helix-turn-helix transcriptional regulator [Ghiorsea sp.]
MIRILLMKKLDDKSFKENRRVTLNEVSEATGLSRPTLTRIANIQGYNTNTDTINALCKYFDCLPKDILEYYPDA